jgi:hypothetical protein
MFNPFLCVLEKNFSTRSEQILRVIKDVNGNLFALSIQSFADIETPENTRDGHESSLLSKSLSTTDSSTPAKCHISSLIRERSGIWIFFQIPGWVESVWIWEFSLIVMDCPYISLNPGSLRNEPALEQSEVFPRLLSDLPCNCHLELEHVAVLQ